MANIRINCKMIISSCDTSIKSPVHVEQLTSIENEVLYKYEKFEPFYTVLCKLSIVNVWQKCQQVRLKGRFDAQNFRQQG